MTVLSPESEAYVQQFRTDYPLWSSRLFKIRDKDKRLVTLRLNRVQRRVGEIEKEHLEKYGNVRIYILKGRQGGITTDQQARSFHLIWSTPGATALTLAHSRDDTDKIFQISRRAVDNFEPDLLPTVGRAGAKEISFPGLDSFFWTGTAGSQRVGRGITLTRFHGSEFAFWEDPDVVLSSVTPAMVPRGSVMVLETTPDQHESAAHKFWKNARQGPEGKDWNGYTAVFFPWWECDPDNYRLPLLEPDELGDLDDEETLLMETVHLTLEEIKWRRSMIRTLGKLKFMREYPEDDETCWIIGGQKFYDADVIWKLLRRVPAPIRVQNVQVQGLRFDVNVYAEPTVDVQIRGETAKVPEDVIIGADVAEGVGESGDNTTFTARSFPSNRLLAMFKSNTIEPDIFGHLLYHVGLEWYAEALLIVEKNQHGITVLRRLRDLRYPRKSIYHRTPLDRTVDVKTDRIGWTTTGESKPLMLDAGREILRAAAEGSIDVPSKEALRDAWSVADGDLTGRDVFVSEILCWIGREYAVRRRVAVMAPLHW